VVLDDNYLLTDLQTKNIKDIVTNIKTSELIVKIIANIAFLLSPYIGPSSMYISYKAQEITL